jgi:hypothetical protein
VARPIAIIWNPEGAPSKLCLGGDSAGAALGPQLPIHHKRPVIPRTDINPPVGDNEIDLLCQGQAVSNKKDAPQSAHPAPSGFPHRMSSSRRCSLTTRRGRKRRKDELTPYL